MSLLNVFRRCRFGCFAAWLTLWILPALAEAKGLEISPAESKLDSPEATLQLLATAGAEGARRVDVTRTVKYRSENPAIAKVDRRGLVEPLQDGQTNIVVEHDGESKRVAISVTGISQPPELSFARDIIPILTKSSCNAGGCHGKAEGQNGFKLSVFGFDPESDHEAITQAARGRRIALAAPASSLLLLKSTAALPHGGGQKIDQQSLRYRRLARWISAGASYGEQDKVQIIRIEVEPARQTLYAKEEQQLRVWAIDSTGARRCVTTEAEYESNAGTIAAIDGRGFIKASETPGEAAILVRYLGHVTACRVTMPRPGVQFARPPEVNFIDKLAWDKLQELGIEPSALCDDATFLRRAYLDVIGTLPTADEARAFLADRAPDKRAKLVDQLLERPEYADYWAMRWSDLLRVDASKISPQGAVAMTRWLRRQLSENRPYDALARDLVTAKGNTRGDSPAAYFKAFDSPDATARAVSQAFLGVRIECAQCHHHPSDRWSQDDYYAMAGLFTSMDRKQLASGGDAITPNTGRDLKHPRTGADVPAKALGAEAIKFAPYEDRRAYLARWMTADDNPLFARMMANRLWAHYYGRGLVEPIDDMRSTNPATNEPLLAALADHLRSVRYDLKAFTRTLLASRLYQLSSTSTSSNTTDEQNFSHAAHKTLPAEVLLDAISQTTGTSEEFQGWPVGTRAIEIWDSKLPSYFFRIFGRPVRATVCECERSSEPSIAQALHLMNSPEVGEKIHHREGTAARAALKYAAADAIIDELSLTALARLPSEDERKALREAFAEEMDKRAAAEDVLWTLINSKEFVYNH